MTKRHPPKLKRDPPWMRLGPAADEPDEGGDPAKGGGRARGGDGERLWRKIAEGVTPLAKTKHKRHAKPLPSPLEGEVARAQRVTEGALSTGTPRARTPSAEASPRHLPLKGGGKKETPPLVPGTFAGLDRSSGDKLRKGKMPVDAKLDLHGMTQQQAHGAVTRFVATQQAMGARCVLIVTGKGKSDDPFASKSGPGRFTMTSGRGVLKDALPRWLNEPGMRPHIVAVSQARQNHGGAGAVYVLLKRKR